MKIGFVLASAILLWVGTDFAGAHYLIRIERPVPYGHALHRRHLTPLGGILHNAASKILNPLGIGQANSGSSAQSQSFSIGGSFLGSYTLWPNRRPTKADLHRDDY